MPLEFLLKPSLFIMETENGTSIKMVVDLLKSQGLSKQGAVHLNLAAN